MFDHRMVGEVDLAVDMQPLGLGLRALELQALGHAHQLDAVEAGQEIVMPPGPAIFAVRHAPEADRFLLRHELRYFSVLHGLEFSRGDLSGSASGARRLHWGRAQQGAYLVGAERRLGAVHRAYPPSIIKV